MKNKNQSGFSLIELLLVLVIVMTLAAIAVPSLLKSRTAAENNAVWSFMRTLSTLEVKYYQQNNRFARLDELNNSQDGNLGTISGSKLVRGNFIFEMSPSPTPSDDDIKDVFTIKATRIVLAGEDPYNLTVDHSGVIQQVP